MSAPHIERTPFAPIEPPSTISLWFCPACGRQITGSYNIDYARKRCTKTWHLDRAVEATYAVVATATNHTREDAGSCSPGGDRTEPNHTRNAPDHR